MPITAANPVISELQDRIRRLEGGAARKGEVLSFGIAEIDAKLPGGGPPAAPCMRWQVVAPMRCMARPPPCLSLGSWRAPKAMSSGV